MIRTTLALALTVALALGVPKPAAVEARASFVERGATVFSFAVPDFWSLTTGGERDIVLPETGEARSVPQILSIRPTVDPALWMAFYAPPGVRTLAEGREYLREIG